MSDRNFSDHRLSDEQLADTLAQFVSASHAGELSEADAARLNALLEESATARQIFLQLAQDTQSLRVWADAHVERHPLGTAPATATIAAAVDQPIDPPGSLTMATRKRPAQHSAVLNSLADIFISGAGAISRAAAAVLLIGSLGAGMLLGALAVAAVPPWNGGAKALTPNRDAVVALMTSFEGSRWTDAGLSSPGGNSLVAGQQLELASGTAQTTFGFGATVVVHGPAKFTPLNKKDISLSAGKLKVDAPQAAHGFTVKTPRLSVVDVETPFGTHTVFGVDLSNDSAVAVHVFQGEVYVRFSAEGDAKPAVGGIRLKAGQALNLAANDWAFDQIPSDPGVFMPGPAESESTLNISEAYVSAVKAAKPAVYWRFEPAEDKNFVRNEVAERWPLRLCGDARLEGTSGNGRAVFSQSPQESWLKTDEAVTAFAGDYSVEFWMKATSYRHGSIFSLLPSRQDAQFKVAGHFDLIGAEHLTFLPGGLRFVHRDPPGIEGGTNVVSSCRYTPRQWHHAVATKDATKLCLYLDGELVGAESDRSRITVDPYVVIGSLRADSSTDSRLDRRPFVGELDEIAIYNRALGSDEIQAHFDLAASGKDRRSENRTENRARP